MHKRICVFVGSSTGVNPAHAQALRDLGTQLVERDHGVVYGGAQVGLMGTLADAALAAGGEVIGVIPEFLAGKEIMHEGLTELFVTRSMHERKARMAELADAFIAAPGGFGTLEELFEVVTWAQLGLHQKPCGLLNVDGYFDSLARFLDLSVEQGFVKPVHRQLILLEDTPSALLDRIESYRAPQVDKWIRPGDL